VVWSASVPVGDRGGLTGSPKTFTVTPLFKNKWEYNDSASAIIQIGKCVATRWKNPAVKRQIKLKCDWLGFVPN
jgi:hypothetical protein